MAEDAGASGSVRRLCNRIQAASAAGELRFVVLEELGRLLGALLAIQLPALMAAEEKLWEIRALRVWLRDFKQAVYDVDNLLDHLLRRDGEAEVFDMESMVPHGCLFLTCASSSPPPSSIEAIRKRVEKLARKQPRNVHLLSRNHRSIETTGVVPEESQMFFRDDDREKFIQQLTSEQSNQGKVSCVAIVGRGGVGKTMLAQHVFEDPIVAEHFDLKMWVSMSQIHDMNRLLRSIVESASGYPLREDLEMDGVLDSLEGKLVENRFLLVLDDVQSGRVEWDTLYGHLMIGEGGSKVVITTQEEDIAGMMGMPLSSYYLDRISEGDCWPLFCKYSFLDRASPSEIKDLEAVGKKIVAKLEGSPLAARMVGCLLCKNLELDDWKMILDADVWNTRLTEYGVPPALMLSYQHLPANIKQCFSYCSVFPNGYKFEKDRLIQMWMAEYLIQSCESIRMEDVGSKYFDYLLQRSFFQNSEDMYIIHSLVQNLAASVSLDESLCFAGTDQYTKVTKHAHDNMRKNVKVRHLSLQTDNLSFNQILSLEMLDSLRTLLFYRTVGSSFDYHTLFMKLKFIRILCLSDKGLKHLPNSISNLKQLRYLDLSDTSIGMVPDELCSLHGLQTLKLSAFAVSLQNLPQAMSNLINLRHLSGNRFQIARIYQIGKLKSLQELDEFVVFSKEGHKIEELKDMAQLHGELLVSQLENVHSEEEATEAKLNEKEYLQKLVFQWTWDYTWDGRPREMDDAVVQGLRPHPNLKELVICNHFGANIPTWLKDGSLSDLQTLTILDCRNWDLALIGQLQKLESLRIDGLLKLQQIGRDNGSIEKTHNKGLGFDQLFPCLRVLNISICTSLREFIPLPPTLEYFRLHMVGLIALPRLQQSEISVSYSSLSSVTISICHRLATLQAGLLQHQTQPQLQALQSLTIQDCNELVYLPEHGFSALVSLRSLCIENCPKLRYLPENGFALPASLIELKIIRCDSLINDSFFVCLERLHLLSYMLIKGMPAVEVDQPPTYPPLTSLPAELLQNLTAIVEVEIVDCEWLLSLGLQSLVSLKRLKISGCQRLTASSSPMFKAPLLLEYLEIEESSLEMLTSELLQRLSSLQELQILKCNDLVSFSEEFEEGLHCLASLKRLHIHECHSLLSLPHELGSIPSLEELYIYECRKIQSIPDNGLPASLLILDINGCRYLKQRCKQGGEDWSKIEHVFYIVLDGQQVGHETVSRTPSSEEYVSSISTLSDWDFDGDKDPHEDLQQVYER